MNDLTIYKTWNPIWKKGFNWTFNLIEILNEVNNNRNERTDLIKAIETLKMVRNRLIEYKIEFENSLSIRHTEIKSVRQFISTSRKLIESTRIDLNYMSRSAIKVFDLFDFIERPDIKKSELIRYIEIVKTNLERNWVAFNQSYGRMLFKLQNNRFK